MLKALTYVIIFDSIGWIFGFLPPLYFAYRNHRFPTWMGIKLLDGGPFGKLGIEAAIILGIVFIFVCSLKLLAAYWVWNARMDGAVLEFILLAMSALFWYGFALPFGPPVGIAQIVLFVLCWGSLH
jgi:hypothetical protein